MAAWANFFMLAAGVAAVLAGLIFVAVAATLEQISKYPQLPPRARATVSNLMLVVMTGLSASSRSPPAPSQRRLWSSPRSAGRS
jgi:hypothetical protein